MHQIKTMASSAETLPNKGSEEEWIMEPCSILKTPELMVQYKCRYGSSMKLIAQGESLIADEFSSSNPNKDWKKYQKDGKELFYCIIEDMSSDAVICVARAVLDFPTVVNSKSSKVQKKICDQKRIILDYIHTAETCRGQGLAADLIKFLQRISRAEGADFYVLSIEESQSYFLTKFDMILEQDEYLREHYNCFSDTFLLKSPDNATGSKDTQLRRSFIDLDTNLDDNQEDVEVSDEESSDADSDLEKAIQESLQSTKSQYSSTSNVIVNSSNEDLSEEQQIEYALALSLDQKSHSQSIVPSSSASRDTNLPNSNEIGKNCSKNISNLEDPLSTLTDEEMLNQAIALSLSNVPSDRTASQK